MLLITVSVVGLSLINVTKSTVSCLFQIIYGCFIPFRNSGLASLYIEIIVISLPSFLCASIVWPYCSVLYNQGLYSKL